MDTGAVLGGLSLAIHAVDKIIVLMHHFKFTSKCCGRDAELTIDTSPVIGAEKMIIQPPKFPDS
jgi:hypothetical protein